MANRFSGSYRHMAKARDHGPRGIGRIVRDQKQAEAEARNAVTKHVRTKQHRLRCTAFGKKACTYN